MRWRGHLELARALVERLGIEGGYLRELYEGVVEPDVEREVGGRHHGPKAKRAAIGYAWKARRALLDGRVGEAMRMLGRALHYVQDLCIDGPGRGHGWLEAAASSCLSEEALDELSRGASRPLDDPLKLESFIRSLRPSRDPHEAMKRAAYATGLVGASVLLLSPPLHGGLKARRWLGIAAIGWLAASMAASLALTPIAAALAPLSLPMYLAYRRASRRASWHSWPSLR